ncbi:DUF2314 domain-containing protein [Hymenobacter sp. H14-R3]|uniref:YegJ family protein n=1 Tax=Hymenobacter sp. H14-R3 TaxID=3046308 RepID=UPI0024BA6940|nr:DUF2314 domain-containing protein [Hymenobacter sp. H14-R3]MDJ0365706.1 DUF2314 domain-containing protein [Hymenobacter sp. H14-R3]
MLFIRTSLGQLTCGLGFLLLGGCQSKSDATNAKIERAGEPTIYTVKSDDAEMDAAIQTSRATLPEFLHVFERQDTATSDFALKVHYDDGQQPEHIWLSNLSQNNGKLYGVISNLPEYTKAVQEGQTVEVDTSKVSDWKYVQHHRLVGGRTIKVLRNQLSPEERQELDASVDYKIE